MRKPAETIVQNQTNRMQIPVPLFPKPIRWGVVAALAAFILYGSLITVPETVVDQTQPEGFPLHLWRHIVAYFTLACALAYATDHWELPRLHNALVVVGLAALYGALMEFGQVFVPHRTDFLITDVAANTLGASGVGLWYLVRPYLTLIPIPELIEKLRSR